MIAEIGFSKYPTGEQTVSFLEKHLPEIKQDNMSQWFWEQVTNKTINPAVFLAICCKGPSLPTKPEHLESYQLLFEVKNFYCGTMDTPADGINAFIEVVQNSNCSLTCLVQVIRQNEPFVDKGFLSYAKSVELVSTTLPDKGPYDSWFWNLVDKEHVEPAFILLPAPIMILETLTEEEISEFTASKEPETLMSMINRFVLAHRDWSFAKLYTLVKLLQNRVRENFYGI